MTTVGTLEEFATTNGIELNDLRRVVSSYAQLKEVIDDDLILNPPLSSVTKRKLRSALIAKFGNSNLAEAEYSRGDPAVSAPGNKRLKVENAGSSGIFNVTRVGKYLSGLKDFQTQSITVENQEYEMGTFVENYLGDPAIPKVVLVRKCYRQLFTKIEEAWESGQQFVTVFGTPGIGKSVGGNLHCNKLILQGCNVFYTYKNCQQHSQSTSYGYLWALPGSTFMKELRAQKLYQESVQLQYMVEAACKSDDGLATCSVFVGEFLINDSTDGLLGSRVYTYVTQYRTDVYHICDPLKGGITIYPANITCKTVVYSSPLTTEQNRLWNKALSLYMPPFELEELQATGAALRADAQQIICKPLVTKDELEIARKTLDRCEKSKIAMFHEMYGGVARHVLAAGNAQAEEVWNKALVEITKFSQLEETFNPFGPNPDTTGVFVHLWPKDSKTFQGTVCKFSTPSTAETLFWRLRQHQNMEMARFSDAATSNGLQVGGLHEQIFLNCLLLGQPALGKCKLRRLSESHCVGSEELKEVHISPFELKTFRSNLLYDVDDVPLGGT